jgi:Cu2+-exporting ATPase
LTKGEFGVTKIETIGNINKKDLLQYAASLEQSSEHPIAVGIIQKAKEEKLENFRIENFNAITGKGVEANVNGKNIKVVSPGYLKEKQISIPANSTSSEAETIVFVLLDNQLAGYVALSDEIRPESNPLFSHLKRMNQRDDDIRDNEKVAVLC